MAQDEIIQLISKSNGLQEEGKIAESILVSKELISFMPESNIEIIELSIAKRYALIQEVDSSFLYLNRSTTNDSSLMTLTNPDFYYLLKDERWAKHEAKTINKYELKNGNIPKREYAKKLLRLKLADQAFFSHIENSEYGTMLYFALWELKKEIKNKSYLKLKELIKKNGYPIEREVPKESTEAAFLIIQHLEDLEEQTKYLPILERAAKNNDIEYSQYAYLLDRVNMRNNKPQIYGTQIRDNKLYNLYKPEEVHARREAVGLEKLEVYLKKLGINE